MTKTRSSKVRQEPGVQSLSPQVRAGRYPRNISKYSQNIGRQSLSQLKLEAESPSRQQKSEFVSEATFTLFFPMLPAKLRLKIMKLALPHRSFLSFCFYYSPNATKHIREHRFGA
jgi:hypothetical protein